MTSSSAPKVLCVFTRILGGKTFSAHIQRWLDQHYGEHVAYLDYTNADCRDIRVPGWANVSNTVESAYRLYLKMKKTSLPQAVDGYFFSAYQLAIPFMFKLSRVNTVMSLDTTPLVVQEALAKQAETVKQKIISKCMYIFNKLLFTFIFKRVDLFLARTELCKHSLVNDFGIDEEKISVTYSPVPLDIWHSSPRSENSQPRMLFVGSDFKRKGGQFILDMHQQFFSDKYVLDIVSDRAIANIDHKNVHYYSDISHDNLDELVALYNQADVFVFPSFFDQLGLANIEAMAMGLPIIARNVGAVSELIDTGNGGVLLAYDSDHLDWKNAIEALLDDSQARKSMSDHNMRQAESKFAQPAFETHLQSAAKQLGLSKT